MVNLAFCYAYALQHKKRGIMPYYAWRGVSMDGTMCKGTCFAPTKEYLDQLLLKQNIALLACRARWQIYLLPISLQNKKLFFEHLQVLLAAGLHVRQALNIISQQIADARLAACIYQISDAIEHGQQLYKAMQHYPSIFSQEMIATAEIGMQVGNPATALKALCSHLDTADAFKKRLSSMLLLPLCTFAVFIVMLFVVLVHIVPRYAQLFLSMGKDIPRATRLLLALNTFLMSYNVWLLGIIIITCGVIAWSVQRKPSVKIKIDYWLLHMPYIGSLIQQVSLVYFLQSLALLLQGGMSLVPALEIARRSIKNLYIKEYVRGIISKVQAGTMLSDAMQDTRHAFFKADLILLMTIGQEGSCLDVMVQRAADIYQQHVNRMLNAYVLVVQPLLIFVLGCLVAALIFAVYTPLFNLADAL